MSELQTVYISIGSNMGDRAANCRAGIAHLEADPQTTVVKQSGLYQTEPVDYLDQGWFLNIALKITTGHSPRELLRLLKDIESRVGRRKSAVRFGPRVLDMDIIFFGQTVLTDPELEIPHPRMHERCFVLRPLCDIDPNIVHPTLHQTVRNLLANIDPTGQEVKQYPCSN